MLGERPIGVSRRNVETRLDVQLIRRLEDGTINRIDRPTLPEVDDLEIGGSLGRRVHTEVLLLVEA